MSDIVVRLKPSYTIRLRREFRDAWTELRGEHGGRRWFVVADQRVVERHPNSLRGLSARARRDMFLIGGGESCKSLRAFEALHRAAQERALDRDTLVVALGGGSVGDLAGFFAATHLRGLDWCPIATTSLAMADSAVGGKTAVNLRGMKNVVGSFHQPLAVFGALEALRSLPARHRRAGLAEVAKSAMVADAALFRRLERLGAALRDPAAPGWAEALAGACRVKARIVAKDEREAGERALLNFGHSFGHALEATCRPRLLHGEAVALGMIAATSLSVRQGRAQAETLQRLLDLLRSWRLVPEREIPGFETLWRAMTYDKKSRAGRPRVVLTEGVGSASFGHAVDRASVRRAFDAIRPNRSRSQGDPR